MKVPRATIDTAALRHNLAAVRRFAPNSKVMAIIKANGYGHGLVATARALSSEQGTQERASSGAVGADAFGVARLEEALALRSAGIPTPIVLLEGVFSRDEVDVAAHESMQIVVHSFEQIDMIERSGRGAAFEMWVKVDTGMNRLGFRLDEFDRAWTRIQALRPKRLRLMTHLSSAEVRDSAVTTEQLARFSSISQSGVERSIANSAGLVMREDARVEWVRPGLMLYGVTPVPDQSAAALGLRPAMTLTTQIIATRRVPVGETVGYNGIWRAEKESEIGIVAAGYGDGYSRHLESGAPVLVKGRETQVVGRVSMDMTAIDLTGLGAHVGDVVTLWGEGLPIDRIAPYAGTIAYELLCGISQRVAVEWKGNG